jgi:hypothetical protein
MLIRESSVFVQKTQRNLVYRIESCSEYSEQEIFQMLQDKKAAFYFDDQAEGPTCNFVSQIGPPYKRLAKAYYDVNIEKMTHTRDTVKEVNYSLLKS